MRNAIIWSRSRIVRAENSMVSKTVRSGQNVTVVPVRPRGASPTTFELGLRDLPPSANSMRWRLPSRSTSTTRRSRQGVDDRHADAVEAAGDLVAVAAELAAAVQLGEGDLDAGHLVLAVDVGRDAAAVVDDLAAAVGQQGDVDAGGVAGHGLVDGVVDDLPDEVVEAGRAGAADVHAGPLPDRFEALEDLHVLGPVGATSLRQDAPFPGVGSPGAPMGPEQGMRRPADRVHDGSESTSGV